MNKRSVAVGLALLGLTACGGLVQKGSLIQVRKAYVAADYEQCIIQVDTARNYFDENIAAVTDAELSFYKGLCLDKAERKDEALALFERVASKYADTDWGLQAAARLKAAKAGK